MNRRSRILSKSCFISQVRDLMSDLLYIYIYIYIYIYVCVCVCVCVSFNKTTEILLGVSVVVSRSIMYVVPSITFLHIPK